MEYANQSILYNAVFTTDRLLLNYFVNEKYISFPHNFHIVKNILTSISNRGMFWFDIKYIYTKIFVNGEHLKQQNHRKYAN